MLNRVILMGRITHDLEVRQTQTGSAVLRFNVAVDRAPAKQGAERQTDFITCIAWNQRAEFINRYFGKGRMIALEGSLRTGSYDDKNGVKHYTVEVWVDNVSFTGEPKQDGGTYSQNYGNGGYNNGGFNNGGYSNRGNGGYNGGGYNNGGFNNNGGFDGNNGGNQNSFNNNNNQAPSNDALNIGDLSEFEDVLSDDGVPF